MKGEKKSYLGVHCTYLIAMFPELPKLNTVMIHKGGKKKSYLGVHCTYLIWMFPKLPQLYTVMIHEGEEKELPHCTLHIQ